MAESADPLAASALRALATLRQGNRVLVRAKDEESLRQQMCETIVRAGGYQFAWYGVPAADEARSVVPVATAGGHEGYLDEVTVSWGEGPTGQGPTGVAIRTGTTQVRNDFTPDPTFKPWLAAATRRGFRASIALPVRVRDRIEGALMVYAAEADAFDQAAQELLEDLAADVGYGLSRLLDAQENARAQLQVVESERRYRLLAENSSDVVLWSDANLRIRWASPSAQTMFGWDPEAMVGQTAADFVHPDDLSGVLAAVTASGQSGQPVNLRYRWRCADGAYRWVEAAGNPIPEERDQGGGRVVRLRDIEQQMHSERELAAREEQYRLLAENVSDVVLQIGADGRIRWASHSVTRVWGWQVEQLIGVVALDLIMPEQQPRLVAMRERVFSGESASDEFQLRKADGSYLWMEVVIRPVPGADGVVRVAALRDIEQEVRARSALEFALGHDQLTGLAVRRVVLGRIATEQHRLPPAMLIGVLCIGIDSLTTINEGLSYSAGDLVITTVATRLAEAVGGADQVGRGAGDEFVVLLPDLPSATLAASKAEELRLAVQGDVLVAGQDLRPTVSIGITLGDRTSVPEELLHDASLALREAKAQGRDRYAFADSTIAEEAHRRLVLERAMREGLRQGEFVPWFQPIVELTSGRVAGYEALVRWRQGEHWVQPGDFLPVAEASSLICEIDIVVMQRSIEAMAAMPSAQFVAVNVSTVTLARTPYASLVVEALAGNEVDPQRLHLEVTETALLSADDPVALAIAELAGTGASWYVDDFGTGYSSISHLRDLPIAGLKLDRSFTAGIGDGDDTCRRLADALAGLARGLALTSVAEGIETEAEAAVLMGQGWMYGQGWLYGRPAPQPIG